MTEAERQLLLSSSSSNNHHGQRDVLDGSGIKPQSLKETHQPNKKKRHVRAKEAKLERDWRDGEEKKGKRAKEAKLEPDWSEQFEKQASEIVQFFAQERDELKEKAKLEREMMEILGEEPSWTCAICQAGVGVQDSEFLETTFMWPSCEQPHEFHGKCVWNYIAHHCVSVKMAGDSVLDMTFDIYKILPCPSCREEASWSVDLADVQPVHKSHYLERLAETNRLIRIRNTFADWCGRSVEPQERSLRNPNNSGDNKWLPQTKTLTEFVDKLQYKVECPFNCETKILFRVAPLDQMPLLIQHEQICPAIQTRRDAQRAITELKRLLGSNASLEHIAKPLRSIVAAIGQNPIDLTE